MGPEYTMWWPWAGMWIFPMTMCAVIMVVVFLFVGRRACRHSCFGSGRYLGENKKSESALDILKKRYVNGEITKEEFEKMKHDILS